MTSPERDYEDILRRALRAAAESVEPAADGLDRIRGRLSAPRYSPFVLLTEFLQWFRPFLLRIDSGTAGARTGLQALATRTQLAARTGQAVDRIRPALAAAALLAARARPLLAAMGWKAAQQRPRAAHRTQPPPTGLRARLGTAFTRLAPAASWLRPVLAVAGAVAIVVAGVFALGQAQQFITPTNQVTHPGVSRSRQITTPPSSPGGAVPIGVNKPPSPTSLTGSPPGARVASSCPPRPKTSASSPAPASSPASTPSPTVTATATPTGSATPTVSPTGTSAASTGAGQVAAVSAKKLLVPCTSASAAKTP
jgi:hypothetical protein